MLHGHAARALVMVVTVSTLAMPAMGSIRTADAAVSGSVHSDGGVPGDLRAAALDDLGHELATADVGPDGSFRLAGLPRETAVYLALEDGDGRPVGYWDGHHGVTADIDAADPAWIGVAGEVRATLVLDTRD